MKNLGYSYALISAVLFGVSTPVAKWLLTSVNPWLLAGLLYFGSGFGLLIIYIIQYVIIGNKRNTLKLEGIKWLIVAIAAGGILAPVMLMFGLSKCGAAATSLLLNLEAVFTALLAWCGFKEHFNSRVILGMVAIVAGGVVLSLSKQFSLSNLIGPLFVAIACLLWALDNNVTRKISAANPIQIAMIKSLVAGLANIGLASWANAAQFPAMKVMLSAGIVGFFGYGLSLTYFILALRHIGSARTGACFALAPFIGAVLAIVLLKETLSLQIAIAGVLMLIGLWLHLTEQYDYEHLRV